MKNILSGLLLCLLIASLPLKSQTVSGLPLASPAEAGLGESQLEQITLLLQQTVDDQLVAGVVAGIAKNGSTAYLQSRGWQDLENRQPMNLDSIFQIRSMSKPITAVAAMQLVEQGKLALSDPVSKYIPRFGYMFVLINPDEPFLSAERKPSREITVEDLLLNTAGLSHRNSPLYQQRRVRSRSDTLGQLVNKVAGVPLINDPGEQFYYSISMTVLGRVIEVASDQPLDDYLRQNVFTPLGMVDTGFYVPSSKADRLALAYSLSAEDNTLSLIPAEDVPITQDPPLKEGAAGMVSTLGDYLRFMQTMLNGGELDGVRILSVATVQKMLSNNLAENFLPIGFSPERLLPGYGWGYGFGVVVDSTQTVELSNSGEFGWSGSLGTFAWADPSTQTIAVFMVQLSPAGGAGPGSSFRNLVHQAAVD